MEVREFARNKFADIFGMPSDSSLVLNAKKGIYNYAVQTARAKGIYCDWS
jgi:hypothetical protein